MRTVDTPWILVGGDPRQWNRLKPRRRRDLPQTTRSTNDSHSDTEKVLYSPGPRCPHLRGVASTPLASAVTNRGISTPVIYQLSLSVYRTGTDWRRQQVEVVQLKTFMESLQLVDTLKDCARGHTPNGSSPSEPEGCVGVSGGFNYLSELSHERTRTDTFNLVWVHRLVSHRFSRRRSLERYNLAGGGGGLYTDGGTSPSSVTYTTSVPKT